MPITTAGAELTALRIGSNIPAVGWLAIGSGSGTFAATQTALIHEVDRNAFSSVNYATPRKVVMISDFSSIEMSGINLREYGTGNLVSGGSVWNREAFSAINFNGTNELQIEQTYEVFRS